jgi:hypothetical protein
MYFYNFFFLDAMRLTSAVFQAVTRAMPSVYITRRVPPKGLTMLQERQLEISQWNSDAPVPQDELIRNVAGKDALFCLLTDKIDKNVIQAAGNDTTLRHYVTLYKKCSFSYRPSVESYWDYVSWLRAH